MDRHRAGVSSSIASSQLAANEAAPKMGTVASLPCWTADVWLTDSQEGLNPYAGTLGQHPPHVAVQVHPVIGQAHIFFGKIHLRLACRCLVRERCG